MHDNEPVRLETHLGRNSRQALRRVSNRLALDETNIMPRAKSSKQQRSAPQLALNGDEALYERQVRICKALANPTRLRILDLLDKHPHTVSGLQKQLGIPLANVSVQLATLRAAGVVATQKKGREVHCFLALPEVRQACHFIRQVLRAQVRNAQKLPI
jgi:DNA-binding transcriptional ArsR family regulator